MARALRVTHPIPTCTEHDLVAAVRRGDDRAFEELFSRYRSRIIAYIFGMVGDHGRAEDIAQEVFISALRRLRDTERPIAFKPWIYEIAKNACVDEYRRSRRAREVPLDDGDEWGSDGEKDVVSSAPGPDAAVESKQQLNDLRGAFGGLSESHHRILVLRELEGLSYGEIGERMGMSRAVVESTLFRARRRLSDEYEELVTGRRCERIHTLIEVGDSRSIRSLGIRERRRIARHLAHCQPCRRRARMAGLDDSLFKAPSIGAKVAALLPIPWLRLRRASSHEDTLASASGSHSFPVVQSLQTAARVVDQIGPSVGVGRVAAAAAALAVAGAGGGIVSGLNTHSSRAAEGVPAASAPHSSSAGVLAVGVTPFSRSSGVDHGGGQPSVGSGAFGAGPLSPQSAAGGAGGAPGGHSSGSTTTSHGAAGAGPLPSGAPSAPPGSSVAPPAKATWPVGSDGSSGAPSTPAVPSSSSGPDPSGTVSHPPHPSHPAVPGGGSGGSQSQGPLPNVLPGAGPPQVPGVGNGGQPPGQLHSGGNGGGSGEGVGQGSGHGAQGAGQSSGAHGNGSSIGH